MDSAFAVSVIRRWPRPKKKFDILGNNRFIDLKTHTKCEQAITWGNPAAQMCPALTHLPFSLYPLFPTNLPPFSLFKLL